MVSRIIPVETFDLVIFGGTGDLSRRKILPALYKRMLAGQVPDGTRIIGSARGELTDDDFRKVVREALETFLPEESKDKKSVDQFLGHVSFIRVDATGTAGWKELSSRMRKGAIHAFYFSVAPSLFGDLARHLAEYKMIHGETRVVVEKPFGRDLETAKKLNAELSEVFEESQIYRIDHYLGKETVQNLMAVRFANVLFEPLWNAQYVDHVQITVAETVDVGGRGAYFDKSGSMRDMVQNHMMQLLCLTAMEPPAKFEPNAVRDEKLKVIRSLDPVLPDEIVRGQYRATENGNGYIEDSENPESKTESFLAMKVHISNWRWAGVPFYLRTGKRLRARMSEIVIVFKDPPHSIFEAQADRRPNVLAIRLQPDEGMVMRVTIKEPGPGGMRLIDVPLDMTFADTLGHADVTDAYERLVMDVIRGNQTLFMRGDEVEAAWEWTDPIIEGWTERGDSPQQYDSGGSGPEDSLMLMHRDGRRWHEIEV